MKDIKMDDIKIDRKMSYDSRGKILTVSADVTTKKSHRTESTEYIGEESIKDVYKQATERKKNLKIQIEREEKNLESLKDQINELKKKGVDLTAEEEKIKISLEKIQDNMNYGKLEDQKKTTEKGIDTIKEDLKDINIAVEEIKQRVKNIKLE